MNSRLGQKLKGEFAQVVNSCTLQNVFPVGLTLKFCPQEIKDFDQTWAIAAPLRYRWILVQQIQEFCGRKRETDSFRGGDRSFTGHLTHQPDPAQEFTRLQ
jgi:hypothetical protein